MTTEIITVNTRVRSTEDAWSTAHTVLVNGTPFTYVETRKNNNVYSVQVFDEDEKQVVDQPELLDSLYQHFSF